MYLITAIAQALDSHPDDEQIQVVSLTILFLLFPPAQYHHSPYLYLIHMSWVKGKCQRLHRNEGHITLGFFLAFVIELLQSPLPPAILGVFLCSTETVLFAFPLLYKEILRIHAIWPIL